jgi:hypothetical protein
MMGMKLKNMGENLDIEFEKSVIFTKKSKPYNIIISNNN